MRLPAICLATLASAACSHTSVPPLKGRLVMVVTVDWEGASADAEGLAALDRVRAALGDAPITHFVSAAYFTKTTVDPTLEPALIKAVRSGDEVAMHLHAWKSLATAAGIAPRLSPSFLTGTDEIIELEDGDAGFDVDLDAYEVADLRALLRTSRQLLEQHKLTVSHAFRAGGYLGTPKMLDAALSEGYLVDSSAIAGRQLDELDRNVLAKRLEEVWGRWDPDSQPAMRAGLLELPIAAVADYSPASEIAAAIEAAHDRLQKAPDHDQFIVLGFHEETTAELPNRLIEAIVNERARPEIDEELLFTTASAAAELARM